MIIIISFSFIENWSVNNVLKNMLLLASEVLF